MLGDRRRERLLLQTLRYAAKHGMTVRFKPDKDFPDNPVVAMEGRSGGEQRMTINTLMLFKSRKKAA